jgi:serine/threonine protein kinase
MESTTSLRPYADSLNPLAVGSRLQEFVIESVIGAGGFGIVYRANDTQLHRTVAIKEYMPSSMAARSEGATISLRSASHAEDFEAGKANFISEARMLARFKHAALIEVFRFWEQNSTAYMATPFYEGKTFKQRLREAENRPNEVTLKSVLLPVLDALEHMHLEQVYHRDVSPDNIMVLNDGRPILLDLGAARRLETENAQALTVLVKPGYAPIEQYAGDSSVQQGAWTDIYGWGATAYYALTGKPPPPSASRIMSDSIVKLAKAGLTEYSNDFLMAIDAALEVRPDDRPQNIASLKAIFDVAGPTLDVERIEAAKPIMPSISTVLTAPSLSTAAKVPVAAPQTSAPSAPKKSLSIGLVGGFVMCAIALLGAFLWFAQTPAPNVAKQPVLPAVIQKTELPKAESSKAESSKAESSKAESLKAESLKAEPQKSEAIKPEPAVAEPQKVEVAKEIVAEKPGLVRLSIKPWGEVIVNGESKGVSPPMKSLSLAAGDHSVEIRNGDYPPHKVIIKLKAGEVFRLNHAFVDGVQK